MLHIIYYCTKFGRRCFLRSKVIEGVLKSPYWNDDPVLLTFDFLNPKLLTLGIVSSFKSFQIKQEFSFYRAVLTLYTSALRYLATYTHMYTYIHTYIHTHTHTHTHTP